MAVRFPNPPTATPDQAEINAFCNAAKAGDTAGVEGYLDKYGDAIINQRDSGRDTALTWAAYTGHTATVELLLARGAQIDQLGMQERTALGWAAYGNRKEMVELLLERGANNEIRDAGGKTPADLAREAGRLEMAEYIRDNGTARRKKAAEEAARIKAEEEGKALMQQRLNDLKRRQPPKLKF